jgi:iron only hydrogenase large subunit-like protein
MKNNIQKIENELKDKETKLVALLAPSFVSTFEYPSIISQLKKLGFDKVTELTFGAKMVNREYHKQLEKSKKLLISSACPGNVETIKKKYPKYAKNIIKVYSPMIATSKICKKIYPKHKVCFISPCEFKKIEAENSEFVDYVIDYEQLKELFKKNNIKESKKILFFDKFYNDYTKIYPLSGGLSKTAHLKGILKPGEEKIMDGIQEVMKFLDSPNKDVRLLDCTFCKGGCIGGPHTEKIPLEEKREKLMHYIDIAKEEKMPAGTEGLIEKAKGIKFRDQV